MKRRFCQLMVIIVILILVFPLLMDKFIVGSKLYSNISNENWVSFLGSYAGGIIGGLTTFISVYFLMKQTILANNPIVIPMNKEIYDYQTHYGEGILLDQYVSNIDQLSGTNIISNIRVDLNNIGNGPVKNFNVKIDYKDGMYFNAIKTEMFGDDDCGYQSTFESISVKDRGTIPSGKSIHLTMNQLYNIINSILYMYDQNVMQQRAIRNNALINKRIKLLDIYIEYYNIDDDQIKEKYGLYIEIDHTPSVVNIEGLMAIIDITFSKEKNIL